MFLAQLYIAFDPIAGNIERRVDWNGIKSQLEKSKAQQQPLQKGMKQIKKFYFIFWLATFRCEQSGAP